jgi:hypothetical protein
VKETVAGLDDGRVRKPFGPEDVEPLDVRGRRQIDSRHAGVVPPVVHPTACERSIIRAPWLERSVAMDLLAADVGVSAEGTDAHR